MGRDQSLDSWKQITFLSFLYLGPKDYIASQSGDQQMIGSWLDVDQGIVLQMNVSLEQ